MYTRNQPKRSAQRINQYPGCLLVTKNSPLWFSVDVPALAILISAFLEMLNHFVVDIFVRTHGE